MWLLFAILSNFFYSLTNVVDQVLRKHHIRHDASLVVLWMACYFVIWLVVLPFISITLPSPERIAAGIASGFIAIFVALPYFYAISNEEISRVMPVWQVSSVFVLIISSLFLGEALSRFGYYGFFLIFAGGIILSLDSFGSFRIRKPFLVVFAASFMWAVSLILVKYFYLVESFWNGFFWFGVGNFLAAFLILLFPGNVAHLKEKFLKLNRASFTLLLVSTLMTLLSEASYLFAIKKGPVSLVSVVGATQIFFVFLISVFLTRYFPKILKEKIDRKTLLTKAAAITLIVAGLVLINGGV